MAKKTKKTIDLLQEDTLTEQTKILKSMRSGYQENGQFGITQAILNIDLEKFAKEIEDLKIASDEERAAHEAQGLKDWEEGGKDFIQMLFKQANAAFEKSKNNDTKQNSN